MLIGLFVFGGWLVRVVADIADKTKDISAIQHFVFLMIAGIFYTIQSVLNLEAELTSKFAVAVYMLFLAFLGYAPGHVWDKLNSFFHKELDKKLGTTDPKP